jgi:hypothetical protein
VNQLQKALLEAANKSENQEFKKMANQAIKKAEVSSKKKSRKKKQLLSPQKEYSQAIKKAAFIGYEGYIPCSFTDWHPGMAVEVNGNPGRIKTGLQKENDRKVALLYEHSQLVAGENFKSFYAVVPVSRLQKCGCNGHMHKDCKPQKEGN